MTDPRPAQSTEAPPGPALGIVGADALGLALALVVGESGRPLLLHSPDSERVRELADTRTDARHLGGRKLPETVSLTDDPALLTSRAQFIIFAVPASNIRQAARDLAPHLDGRHVLVHALGALDVATAQADDGQLAGQGRRVERISEMLRRLTPAERIGALAGPTLAVDLIEGRPCGLVVASPFAQVRQGVQQWLSTPPRLRVYIHTDMPAVELASGLALTMSIALGIADGLDFGAATRGLLMSRALAEMARIVAACGAGERAVWGMAGLGNLLVRCAPESSAHSEEYALGLAMGRWSRTEDEAPDRDPRPRWTAPAATAPEGAAFASAMRTLAGQKSLYTPLTEFVDEVVNSRLSVRDGVARLLEGAAREE